MPKELSRRLAGCIAIELLLAAGLVAAAPEYKAATASAGKAKALALEDRRGNRAVFVAARFDVPNAVADFIAAQAGKLYGLDRPGLLLDSVAPGEPVPGDALTAIGAALGALEPAVVRYGGGTLSVTAPDGRCRAAWPADRSCAAGGLVRSPIRSAFQMVEPPHGLQQRGEPVPSVPVQAIALGKQFVIVVPPRSDDEGVSAAIRQVLARVGQASGLPSR
jgi:hypothetical protein